MSDMGRRVGQVCEESNGSLKNPVQFPNKFAISWKDKQTWLDSMTAEERAEAFDIAEERKKKIADKAAAQAVVAAAATRVDE